MPCASSPKPWSSIAACAAASCRRRSKRRSRYGKPLLSSGRGQALVERDHFERGRPVLCRDERRCELQRIGGTQLMYAEEPHGRFTNGFARIHLVPPASHVHQAIEGLRNSLGIDAAVALEAR